MRHLEQLEKRSEKGSTQQAVIIERFGKSFHFIHLNNDCNCSSDS